MGSPFGQMMPAYTLSIIYISACSRPLRRMLEIGHQLQNSHIISVHIGRYKCSSVSQIACNVCNVQILPLGGIYSTLSYSSACASVFRELLPKGNMAEKSFRGTLIQQQGNAATIWDTLAPSQFSTVYNQLRTYVYLPTDFPVLYCDKPQQEDYLMLPKVISSLFQVRSVQMQIKLSDIKITLIALTEPAIFKWNKSTISVTYIMTHLWFVVPTYLIMAP